MEARESQHRGSNREMPSVFEDGGCTELHLPDVGES